MDYIFTPWKSQLLEDLGRAKRHVLLVSPFIKSSIARDIYRTLAGQNVTVHTISRFSKSEFLSGASDIEAHYVLSGRGNGITLARHELRSLSNLHAKIFIIDWEIAYVGSSNLTFSGLLRNYEGTVRLTGEEQVRPLRERFEKLWKGLPVVAEGDFADMVEVLANSQTVRQDDSEHLYDTRQPLSAEGRDVTSVIADAVQQEPFHSPITIHDIPSIETLSAGQPELEKAEDESGLVDDNTAGTTMPEDAEAPSPALISSRRFLLEHVQIIRRFLCVLRNRLGLQIAPESAWRYALPIRTPGVQKLWSEELVSAEAYSPVDAKLLYADQEAWLDGLGDAVYDSCAAQIAVKAGIVALYGINIANQFKIKARAADLMSRLWHQNFLGPLVIGPSIAGKLTDEQRRRMHACALKRLLAVIYLDQGMQFVQDLCEEFFNAADLLGTDIVSLIDYEPTKTTLQILTQTQGIGLPVYSEPTVTGPEHDLEFTCTVTIGKTICAEGKGKSQRAATASAAEAALAQAARHPQWSRALEQRREQLLQDAHKRHYPLFPNAGLSPERRALVRTVYQRRYGIDVQPSLGFAACVDQETKKFMRLGYCHDTMAWYGSSILEVVRRETRRDERVITTSQFWLELGRLLNIQDLRSDLGITEGWDGRHGQWAQTVQAITCAVYFSNPHRKFLDWLSPLVTQIESALRSQDTGSGLADRLKAIVLEYDSTRVYTTSLQEATQAQAQTLPVYSSRPLGVPGRPKLGDLVEVSAAWDGVTVRAEDKSKRQAKNRAAFLLLKALLEQNRLS